ncbi:S8 family serine peptidase [Bacillus cereus]|uniref:S8 family serine peptidase n=1 Tax=Bacillus cereus TaxID=1396 RepID=UPI000279D4FA|nr:S8 family serine peptidase [Bacillus cereus]EJR93296.1 LPXTG-domain-containing protein cell wall anchor domain [Bacillus cereus VD200]
MKKSMIVFLSLIIFVTCRSSYSYAEMTNPPKHFTGKGIKVAVIDTGIDSTHPDLKKNYLKGYDFIDNDTNPEDTVGHGTHVAGIIAANGTMKGVAPDASILAYRVSEDPGDTEMIIKAINQAIEDGAHIINLSLETPLPGTDTPINQAIQKAIAKNITVVSGAGNSGPEQWSLGSLTSTPESISVGNAKQQGIIQNWFQISGTQHFIPFRAIKGGSKNLKPGEYSVVHFKNLTVENIKKQDNLKNTIVIFDSVDDDQWTDSVQELQKRGVVVLLSSLERDDEVTAKKKLHLNNTDSPKNNETSLPEDIIEKEEKQMFEEAAREQKVVTITQDSELRIDTDSSRGPAIGSWQIKPDIAAYGVDIESTFPRNMELNSSDIKPFKKEGYAIMSGTSMAAPRVAGAAALLKQAHPDWSPYEIRAALTSTATLIKEPNNTIVTPLAQGSGLVDIAKALEADILPLTNNLSFGFLQSNVGVQTITQNLKIKNVSNSSQTLVTDNQALEGNAEINIPSSITIPPHQTIEIPVTLQVDTSLKISKHIGMLYLKQDEKQMNIPYIVCVDPKDYPFLSMYGPVEVSNDNFPYLLRYYSPFSVEQLTISITGQTAHNQPFSSVLMEKNTPSKGYQEFKWDGRDQNKKLVPKGTYELTITAKDSSQFYQISRPLTISGTDEKTVESPKINKVTDQDTKITGTGEKGAIVKVAVDGKEIGMGTVDDQGNFTVDIPKQPGGKEVVVTLTDAAGNTSQPTKTKVEATDVTAPDAPKVNKVTNQDTKVTGTGEKGATVKVVVDGKEIGTGKVDDQGNYTVDIPKQPGGKEIIVTLTDAAGHTSQSTKLIVEATDVTPPNAPKVNKVTDQDTKITGTGEKGAIVKVTVDGKEIGTGTVDDQGNFTVDIPKQPGGKEVVVTLTDADGNVSKLAKTKLKIDPSKEGQKNINNDHQVIDTNPEDAPTGYITKGNGSTMNSQYQGNLPKTGGKEGMMDTLLGLGAITMAFFVRRMK